MKNSKFSAPKVLIERSPAHSLTFVGGHFYTTTAEGVAVTETV